MTRGNGALVKTRENRGRPDPTGRLKNGIRRNALLLGPRSGRRPKTVSPVNTGIDPSGGQQFLEPTRQGLRRHRAVWRPGIKEESIIFPQQFCKKQICRERLNNTQIWVGRERRQLKSRLRSPRTRRFKERRYRDNQFRGRAGDVLQGNVSKRLVYLYTGSTRSP